MKPNLYFDGLPLIPLHFCVYDEDSFTQMKWSNAEEVTLRAVLEMLLMYLCPHLMRRQTLILGVDRLSAPILSILPIIDIGHFQNRFGDFCLIFFYANKHTIYR